MKKRQKHSIIDLPTNEIQTLTSILYTLPQLLQPHIWHKPQATLRFLQKYNTKNKNARRQGKHNTSTGDTLMAVCDRIPWALAYARAHTVLLNVIQTLDINTVNISNLGCYNVTNEMNHRLQCLFFSEYDLTFTVKFTFKTDFIKGKSAPHADEQWRPKPVSHNCNPKHRHTNKCKSTR